MNVLIKNGTIVTAENEYKSDIFIEDEKIQMIASCINQSADLIIDAQNKYILPGGIDQHTHFDALCNSGCMNTSGYEATDSVLRGGTTTIIDYAPQDPGKGLIDSIEFRKSKRAEGVIAVDYSLHALVTDATSNILEEIPHLAENGVPTIKLFMAYKGSPLYVDDGVLFNVLSLSARHGITVFVHAENADIIDTLQKRYLAEGKYEPKYHAETRPPFVEAEAAERAITIAKAAGAPVHIVHVSCAEAAKAIQNARANNEPVFGECVTHHLVLTDVELSRPNFEGSKYVCSPPLRNEYHIDALWNAIKNNWIQTISSDHCGIDYAVMKHLGFDDFTQIPNGSPGAADRIHMIWTHGVETGRISKQRFVDVTSTYPAKVNGIFPQKGHIGIGSDADILIFDPNYRGIVNLKDNPNGVDFNVYEGLKQIGKVEKVLLRGMLVVNDGEFVGQMGQGRFIPGKTYGQCYQ